MFVSNHVYICAGLFSEGKHSYTCAVFQYFSIWYKLKKYVGNVMIVGLKLIILISTNIKAYFNGLCVTIFIP